MNQAQIFQLSHFQPENFSCQCLNCSGFPDPRVMTIADRIRTLLGQPLTVTSGFRCPERNKEAKGAAKSKHLHGLAVDLAPVNLKNIRSLHKLCISTSQNLNIWIEDPTFTPTWCHVQIVPYSGWTEGMSRVFKP